MKLDFEGELRVKERMKNYGKYLHLDRQGPSNIFQAGTAFSPLSLLENTFTGRVEWFLSCRGSSPK